MSGADLVVLDSPDAVASRAADDFAAAADASIGSRGRFAVALSGGRTPRVMLEQLASRSIDWSGVHFFWSDERCVGPDDPESNYGMAHDALLAKIAVPASNVHRMRGELAPDAGADAYNAELATFFSGSPVFDLLFLGLGPDGHTASLFPGTSALHASGRWCIANRVDSGVASPWRLTLTYAAINAACSVRVLVEGAEKAGILASVLLGQKDVERYPAQGIAPVHGDLRWLVDAAAAAKVRAADRTSA